MSTDGPLSGAIPHLAVRAFEAIRLGSGRFINEAFSPALCGRPVCDIGVVPEKNVDLSVSGISEAV
jgi:hypothetical protein